MYLHCYLHLIGKYEERKWTYGFSADGWVLLAARRPTRQSSEELVRVGRACAVGEFYRGWNEPRAVKDGRHPCELRSSCRNFHPTTTSSHTSVPLFQKNHSTHYYYCCYYYCLLFILTLHTIRNFVVIYSL